MSHDIEDHDLKLSKGWLQSFKKRNNIKRRALTGESGRLCIGDVQAAKYEIRSLIEQYSPSDVFNFDETSIFYDLPPNKTLYTIRSNGKKSVKSRVTVALCCNASGSEKLEAMIVGKFKNPRCFEGV